MIEVDKSGFVDLIETIRNLSADDARTVLLACLKEMSRRGLKPSHYTYKYIVRNGKKYGPYAYHSSRARGRVQDLYLGKVSEEEYQEWKESKNGRRER